MRLFEIRNLGIALLLPLFGCGDDGAGTTGSGAGAPSGPSSGPGASTGQTGSAMSTGSMSTASSSASTGMTAATFAEMCAAPGVVFCDGFEGTWDPSWMEDGGDVAIVPGAAVTNEGASVIQLSTYENIQSSKLLRTFPDADRIHIRFDVQYDAAYDNSGGSHGLILGVTYDTIGHELIGMIRRRNKPASPQPPRPSPTPSPEPV